MDWFQIEKGVWKGCMSSPCLLNLYADFIMQNAALDESQARIKSAGRNISNLRYADNTTLMAESEGELKSLLIRVKEESGKIIETQPQRVLTNVVESRNLIFYQKIRQKPFLSQIKIGFGIWKANKAS